MELITKSPKETQDLARKIAKEIRDKGKSERATIIELQGELGAGKTTFTQAFVNFFIPGQNVKSPTFLLMKKYNIPTNGEVYSAIYHIDCYRIDGYEELEVLEIEDIISDSKNIILIEWPERIRNGLKEDSLVIHIDHISPEERKITVSGI